MYQRTHRKIIAAIFGVTVVLLVLVLSAYADSSKSLVYHAYFRKVAEEDPGTAHLFVINSTKQDLKVSKFFLNGYEMADMPNDLAIWYQAVPYVARPGEVMDVMVKLRRPTHKLVRVTAVLSNGQEVSAVMEPTPPGLKFSFIGYSKEKDRVYLYLENTGGDSLKIKRIFCNAEVITKRCFIPEKTIAASSKALIIFQPKSPLPLGGYKVFKAETDKGVVAAAVSRVYSHFPITAFGGDTRVELGFDKDPFEVHYPGSLVDFQKLKNEQADKAYHLIDDPACNDGYAYQLIGSHAKEIFSRAAACYENDPAHPNLVYSCEHFKPYSYYVYGETVDIFTVDPYEMYFHRDQPIKSSEYVGYAKMASEPRPLWTIPEAFTHDKNPRFPTPEEERITVYSEIGEGSKGIWYFIKDSNIGYSASPPLEAEIGRINRELQVLRDYIVIGERFPLAKASADKIKTYSLLCGDKAILLLLVNNDCHSSFDGGKAPFAYIPKENFEVRCRIPSWLKVAGVLEVSNGEKVPIKYDITEGETVVPVDKLDITKQVLILTERNK